MTSAVEVSEEAASTGASRGPSTIEARVTHGRGRYVIDAENKVFVSDSVSRPEGAVAVGPSELLLSALGVSALGSVQRHADEQSLAIGAATVARVTLLRNEDKPRQFKYVHLEVFVDGVSQSAAEGLVTLFTQSCPIYNTVRRGGPVSVEVVTEGARRVISDNSNEWSD